MHKRFIPALFQHLSGSDNIIGIGHGTKWVRGENTGEEAIIVLVRKKYRKGALARNEIIPQKLNNKKTDIIEVGDIRLLNERTSIMRPAKPGISIGHYKVSAGTFGAVVKDCDTGESLILSNNHVLANSTNGSDSRASIGDPILQPGTFDGNNNKDTLIGHLYRFAPLYRFITPSQCSLAQLFEATLNKCISLIRPYYRIRVLRQDAMANTVDCAVAKPLRSTMIVPDILGYGSITGIKDAFPGMEIKKSGRSTGLTSGFVLATDVTVRVDVGAREYGIFTDQVLSSPISIPGDSGSLILTEDNFAVGLLFAGSEQATMLNRIQNVLNTLNVTI